MQLYVDVIACLVETRRKSDSNMLEVASNLYNSKIVHKCKPIDGAIAMKDMEIQS